MPTPHYTFDRNNTHESRVLQRCRRSLPWQNATKGWNSLHALRKVDAGRPIQLHGSLCISLRSRFFFTHRAVVATSAQCFGIGTWHPHPLRAAARRLCFSLNWATPAIHDIVAPCGELPIWCFTKVYWTYKVLRSLASIFMERDISKKSH